MNRVLSTLVAAAVLAGHAKAQEAVYLQGTRGLAAAGVQAGAIANGAAARPPGHRPAVPASGDAPAREPLLQEPTIIEFGPAVVAGRLIAAFPLAERLDAHLDMFRLRLGARDWELSMASDPGFKIQYLTLRDARGVALRRIDNLRRLRGDGVRVRVEDGVVYNFKVSVNLFSPTRGSTLKIDPLDGTRGPAHRIKTGKVLDAVARESFVFQADGRTFWLLYGSDVDPESNAYAETRSLLFVHEDGLDSKAWPLAEARLRAGRPLAVGLGATRLVLTRSLSGDLRIHLPAAR